MDHYNEGDGLQNPWLDEDIQPLTLTDSEIDDVIASLALLTSADYAELGRKELARQRELSRTKRPATRHGAGVRAETARSVIRPPSTPPAARTALGASRSRPPV